MRLKKLSILMALIPAMISTEAPRAILYPYETFESGYVVPVDPKQVKCLAITVFGEARGEPRLGKVAVAYTAVNRAKTATICKVVLAPMQYSVFNNNPSLRAAALSKTMEPHTINSIDKENWNESVKIARDVLSKRIPDPTNGGTHFFSAKVMAIKNYTYPRWIKKFKLVAVIGDHQFFKPPEKS